MRFCEHPGRRGIISADTCQQRACEGRDILDAFCLAMREGLKPARHGVVPRFSVQRRHTHCARGNPPRGFLARDFPDAVGRALSIVQQQALENSHQAQTSPIGNSCSTAADSLSGLSVPTIRLEDCAQCSARRRLPLHTVGITGSIPVAPTIADRRRSPIQRSSPMVMIGTHRH